jgi:hypothetical protein
MKTQRASEARSRHHPGVVLCISYRHTVRWGRANLATDQGKREHNMNDGTARRLRNLLATSGLSAGLSLWRLSFISSGNACERSLTMGTSVSILR